MYLVNVIIFNEIHLRHKGERLGWVCLYVYYLPYKITLTFINVASCYWSLWKYARYFAKRHPKVVEDAKAVEVVVRLEEEGNRKGGLGRRMTVKTIRTNSNSNSNIDVTSLSPLELDSVALDPPGANGGMSTPTRVAEGILNADFAFGGSIDDKGDMSTTTRIAEGTQNSDFTMAGAGAVVEVQDEGKGGPSTPARRKEGNGGTEFAKVDWIPRSEKNHSSKASTSNVDWDAEKRRKRTSSMSTSSLSHYELSRQAGRRVSVSQIV
jgi:hypothetical protein